MLGSMGGSNFAQGRSIPGNVKAICVMVHTQKKGKWHEGETVRSGAQRSWGWLAILSQLRTGVLRRLCCVVLTVRCRGLVLVWGL